MRYFLDCEFDGFGGQLISLALLREDHRPDEVKRRFTRLGARDAYYVLKPIGDAEEWGSAEETWRHNVTDPWVKENVAPILWACRYVGPHILWGRREAAMDIASFLAGDPDPVIIADWPADVRYFCELIELPGGNMVPINRLAFRIARVDSWPNDLSGAVQHNAWWDAIALRYRLLGIGP